MFVAYLCPDNYATQTKTKVCDAPDLEDAIAQVEFYKTGWELLAVDVEPDGSAADMAFGKAGQIQLFTIEKE